MSRFTTIADLPLARGPSAIAAAHNSAIPPALGGIGAPVSWSQQQQLGSIGGASAEPVRVAIQVRIACWSASVRSPCGVPAGVDTHATIHLGGLRQVCLRTQEPSARQQIWDLTKRLAVL